MIGRDIHMTVTVWHKAVQPQRPALEGAWTAMDVVNRRQQPDVGIVAARRGVDVPAVEGAVAMRDQLKLVSGGLGPIYAQVGDQLIAVLAKPVSQKQSELTHLPDRQRDSRMGDDSALAMLANLGGLERRLVVDSVVQQGVRDVVIQEIPDNPIRRQELGYRRAG